MSHAALALAQAGTSDVWEPGAHPWVYQVGAVGPWVLGALVAVAVARALRRRRRYRASALLDQGARARVQGALADVEQRTTGEVLAVVLERSDAHPGAKWLTALTSLLVASTLLAPWLPWNAPHWLLLLQVAFGAAGYWVASWLPDLERVFVGEARASEVAEEQAFQEFHRQGLHKTRDATGVLLFVSLFERRIVVLGDAGIDARVGAEHWSKTREAILAGIARGSLCDGLVEGIRVCGAVLAEHFPVGPGDRNEVPDRLIVRRA